jgi:hypothetical protein
MVWPTSWEGFAIGVNVRSNEAGWSIENSGYCSFAYSALASFRMGCGRESSRTSSVCGPLLRADRDSSSGAMSERTATIRCHRTATLGSDSEGAADWLHAGRDQTTLFWVSQGNPPFSPLAGVEEAEDCRTQGDLEHIPTMCALVEQQGNCRCTALEECGKKIFEKQCRKSMRSAC